MAYAALLDRIVKLTPDEDVHKPDMENALEVLRAAQASASAAILVIILMFLTSALTLVQPAGECGRPASRISQAGPHAADADLQLQLRHGGKNACLRDQGRADYRATKHLAWTIRAGGLDRNPILVSESPDCLP